MDEKVEAPRARTVKPIKERSVAQVFNRSANTVARASLVFGPVGLFAVAAILWFLYYSPAVTMVGIRRDQPIPFSQADRIIAIGSDGMMNAVRLARHGVLKPFMKPDHRALGSINSPMQCMMKGVCAQCLCKHIDPETGQEYFVYSCYNQDQDLDRVDFPNLQARLRQNSVQEKLSGAWLAHLTQNLPSGI